MCCPGTYGVVVVGSASLAHDGPGRGFPMSAGRHRRRPLGRWALRMAIAAAIVAVGGVGIAIYGLTTKVPVAGATYTPATVGTTAPQVQADPQATALSRSTPVRIQIPAIHVSAP